MPELHKSKIELPPAQRATPQDAAEIFQLVKTCSDWLLEQGFDHWASWYTQEKVAEKINDCQVFFWRLNGKVVACVALSLHYDDELRKIFQSPDVPAVYMGMLGVHPEAMQHGLGKQILAFVEEQTREQGISRVRFDCRAEIEALVNFYMHADYGIVGSVSEGPAENYYLFEKLV
jgi:ribosomal protein S18 acetylase RimI-like enzyme